MLLLTSYLLLLQLKAEAPNAVFMVMRKTLFMMLLVLFAAGCIRTPLDRLNSFYGEGEEAPMTYSRYQNYVGILDDAVRASELELSEAESLRKQAELEYHKHLKETEITRQSLRNY